MCSVQFVKTEIVCDFSMHYKMLSKQKRKEKKKQTRCSCLPIISNLHPFKIFWHLVLYSSAIANPRYPASTRLDETCFPTDFCSLLCSSTFFLLTANGHISPLCLLHHHLAGETVLWWVWDCTHFVWPLSHCQTECITAMFCLPLPLNWHQLWVFFLHTLTDFHKTWYSLRISSFRFNWEKQKGSKHMKEGKNKGGHKNLSRSLT